MSFSSENLIRTVKDTNWSSTFNRNDFYLWVATWPQIGDFLFQSFDNSPRLVTGWKDASVVFDTKFKTPISVKVDDVIWFENWEKTL